MAGRARPEPPRHIDCANSDAIPQDRCYAVLEKLCSSGDRPAQRLSPIAEHPDSVFALCFTHHFEHAGEAKLLVRRNHHCAAGMSREDRRSCHRAHVIRAEIDSRNGGAIHDLGTTLGRSWDRPGSLPMSQYVRCREERGTRY